MHLDAHTRLAIAHDYISSNLQIADRERLHRSLIDQADRTSAPRIRLPRALRRWRWAQMPADGRRM
jgi:hypothetical protein